VQGVPEGGHEFTLRRLTGVELAFDGKILQKLIIGINIERLSIKNQQLLPFLKGKNNGEKFLIINWIITLGKVHNF
jgi:hypothetical protein